MPLTDVAIKNAKPADKAIRLFDGGGLYLEVSPAGGKWWRLKYRYDGKEKRLSLGVYPDVGLKEARQRREDARKLLANDVDPSENRKALKLAKTEGTANSFEVVAREWFSKHAPNWKAYCPRPMSENTVLAALRRMGYTTDEMTGHGFRIMASTLLNEQCFNPRCNRKTISTRGKGRGEGGI